MTLNQSALLELNEAMRTADGGQLMRTLLQTILQALVEPRPPHTSVPACMSRTRPEPRNATVPGPRSSPRPRVT